MASPNGIHETVERINRIFDKHGGPEHQQYSFVIDTELHRPGCALIQAMGGCNTNVNLWLEFPVESWLTAPTLNMKLITGSLDQWRNWIANIPSQEKSG
jgi:hypothetical protein